KVIHAVVLTQDVRNLRLISYSTIKSTGRHHVQTDSYGKSSINRRSKYLSYNNSCSGPIYANGRIPQLSCLATGEADMPDEVGCPFESAVFKTD
ncbi:unnamed protein product, partial [Ilex paraguariensis]